MKKMLFVTASFFAFGGLWISPLHAMEVEEKEIISKKRNSSILGEDLGNSEESPVQKKPCLSSFDQEQFNLIQDIKNANLDSTVNKTENKYFIDDYRKVRDLCIGGGIQYADAREDGASLAHQVTDLPGATDEDWRIARDAFVTIGDYSMAYYFVRHLPDFQNKPLQLNETRAGNFLLKLDDTRKARDICLQTQAFETAYTHSQSVIKILKNNSTFEDYYPLILSDIGSHEYDNDVSNRIEGYIQILEKRWNQDPEVQFFISFLKEMDEFRDFSNGIVEKATTLEIDRTIPFTQILQIFILEDSPEPENVKMVDSLKENFCEKFSQKRYESELNLLRTIWESLANESEEDEEEQDLNVPPIRFHYKEPGTAYHGISPIQVHTINL